MTYHQVFDALRDVNWLGVAVATVGYYLLGALWFTPLFGKAWDAAVGFDRPKGNRFPAVYYVVPLACAFAVAIATAVLVEHLDVAAPTQAVVFGTIVGLGYAAAVSFNNAVAPNTSRPALLGAVVGGYHVAGIILVSVIVTATR